MNNLAHVHLLLNHFPIIGFMVGLALLIISLLWKSEDLKRASFLIIFGIAMLAFPTYLSGNAANEQIRHISGIQAALIQRHQDSALLGFIFIEITGGFAWLGLWQFQRLKRIPGWTLVVTLMLSLLTAGLMSFAGNTGGDIRHPEIEEANFMTTLGPSVLDSKSVGAFVTKVPWMWPTCETLHFVGLCLLFGIVFLLNLRMLGVMKNVSFRTLHRLLPWAVLGFGINLITGMFFFVGASDQYTQNGAFHWKIVLILLAGVNALYFTIFDQPFVLESGDEAPLTGKVFALSAIALWIGVMYCGSMLPFLGNAF